MINIRKKGIPIPLFKLIFGVRFSHVPLATEVIMIWGRVIDSNEDGTEIEIIPYEIWGQ